MSMTLGTAAALMAPVYDPAQPAPEGIELGDWYDHEGVQAVIYHDKVRGKVGCGVRGSDERRDWRRNFNIRPINVRGFTLASGWYDGAAKLAPWCAERGVQELDGHSMGGAVALDTAFEMEYLLKLPTGSIQVIALCTPHPFRGLPPALAALCLFNPRDIVHYVPPAPIWTTPGTGISLPLEAPGWRDYHTMGPVLTALKKNGLGHLALMDGGSGEDTTIAPTSRGMEMTAATEAADMADTVDIGERP